MESTTFIFPESLPRLDGHFKLTLLSSPVGKQFVSHRYQRSVLVNSNCLSSPPGPVAQVLSVTTATEAGRLLELSLNGRYETSVAI